MAHQFTNKLINESSPYLLQHAHNPVQWYPWGEESLLLAKTENKPILVSIGYSACHWCHVMERESFEDEKVAEFMNLHFINIKIDREERPDLDHIYMDAVQAIAGSGGWPLNVFLTTDAKPFYGGTYFPPAKAYNRPSWMDVLNMIRHAWENKRDDLETQAEELLDHVKRSGNFIKDQSVNNDPENFLPFTREDCENIAKNMLKNADTILGGFGNAPKFPQTFSIQYLLGYSHFFNDKPSLMQAELSLKKMLNGGIYDHLAGGLCRYSTDAKWLAPHFEKMLYDNALLVSVLADAFQLTQDEFYAKAMVKTINFFVDEMRSVEGGFFAALDADSEGVEGKFYVWDFIEVEQILGDKASLYCKWYGISKDGNWEEKNILHIEKDEQQFCEETQISPAELHTLIEAGNRQLLDVRKNRMPPQTDDKIILGWNALFLTALCKASAALGSQVYKELAVSLFDFIMIKYKGTDTIRFHTYKNGNATHPAFLDDYAYLIQAAILLQEITADQSYLQTARNLTEYVLANFENRQNGFFYYTHIDQPDLITRKVECYDGAVPSGNSIMAENLIYLSAIFGIEQWKIKGEKLLHDLRENIIKYPTSFGVWASHILKQVVGVNEIVITGKSIDDLKNQMLKEYIPNKVFQSSTGEEGFPLLEHKEFGLIPYIYVCRNQVCSAPLKSLNDLKLSLKVQFINNKVHNI